MLDTATISTSTMAKNYSHCPLKKRPIQFVDTEEEPPIKKQQIESLPTIMDCRKIRIPTPPPVKIEIKDEPENLCTKPQDLSKRSSPVIEVPLPIVPTSVITTNPYPPKIQSPQEASIPVTVISSTANIPRLGGAFHRVMPVRSSPEPIQHYAPTNWHRSVAPVPQAPHYPPAYFPLGYPYSSTNEIYHPYPLYPSPPSPYAPRDSSCSPPHHITSRQPLAPLALLPESRPQIDRASLSPASSGTASMRSHSPTYSSEPADLSPPTMVEPQQQRRVTTTNNARHQCPDCGKSYSTFSGLSKHRQFHCAAGDGPRKSFSCKYCEKVYVSLGALKMHIRTHTLPCKCTLCGKAFSRPWLLQGHIRTHTGEKPFSCQHCHRAFADRSNLRAHLQTHSDVKKYSCPSCSKTFSRMSLLTKHAEGGCNGSAHLTTVNQSLNPTNIYSHSVKQEDLRHLNQMY
ncbi:protein escargot-like [Chrysoperla carnea]|uniref:protein escargot-like n=1 Tax=Chrysoperla carnea TaxID=189513 RepID=UPI001D070A8A|nr:protein escargot-like [Chrysoperla carnea]